MNFGFWKKLKKPILALAPMADVTDNAFRQIIAKYGKPDVMFTEFVSCDGLCSQGRKKLLTHLQYTEEQRPIVAQFFGANPENFYRCALLAQELGFDGIDINMGCPEKNAVKQGSCAALILKPDLACAIIAATKRGAGKLPVSVKTRIGFQNNVVEEWMKVLLSAEPAVITLHARTKKEMSKVPAHWDAIGRAVVIRDQCGSKTLLLGNGDVRGIAEAKEKTQEFGVDGVMLGRAIFGNPWLFHPDQPSVTVKEKLSVLLEHTLLFEKLFAGKKPFDLMKKHFKAYIAGWDGAKELRMKLMLAKNVLDARKIFSSAGAVEDRLKSEMERV